MSSMWEQVPVKAPGKSIQPLRIGHVVIKVSDVARSHKFYSEVLGLDLMSIFPEVKMAMLASRSRDHHEIALMQIDGLEKVPGSSARFLGVQHIAFKLETRQDLKNAYKVLKDNNVPIVCTANHGINDGIYFEDPDGNLLEVYHDHTPEEIREWEKTGATGMERLDFTPNERSLEEALQGRML